MPSSGIRLGVDFGTSNTVAVVRWPDGRSRTLLFDGSPLLPSAVYAEPDAIVVGRDAVHSARMDPARFEPNPKRRIDDGMVLLGDRELPVGELITAVLKRVELEWRRTVGGAEPEVSITFPASWGATRRLILADAAQAAGLGRVRLVPEPVAAAAYFTQVLGRDVPIGSVVVVHDFGAGTFDASVVARTAGGFEVLAVDGRDDIGGIDVDNAIVAHIGTIAVERDAALWQRLLQPSTVEDRRARRMLWDDARVAKERLSRQPAADLTVPLLNLDVHLTREELERLAQPLLEQTIRVTQGVMRWAKLTEGRMAGVFLVGGSSRIPLVATMLHRSLGTAPVVIEQPELVVAEGSLVGGAAAIPVSAAPAPSPATGVLPKIDINQLPVPGSGTSPVSGLGPLWPTTPTPSPAGPVSAPPVSTSASYPGPLDAAGPVSGLPASAPPLSSAPGSGAPSSGGPQPGQPGQGQAGFGQPGPAQPSFGQQGGGQSPGGQQAFGQPGPAQSPFGQQSGGQSPGGQQAFGQPGGRQQPGAQPPPFSGAPVSGSPAQGFGTPGNQPGANAARQAYRPPPAPPVSSPPVSAPPDRAAGRVFVSGSAPVSPAVGYPVSPANVRPVTPAPPRPPVYQPPPPQVVVVYRDRRSAGGRFFAAFMIIILLVATPVVAGYVAYWLTTGDWPPPVNTWLG